jgi:hypothetical protein
MARLHGLSGFPASAALFLLTACSTDPGIRVPEVGVYAFSATWSDYSVVGQVTISATELDRATYTFVIQEPAGPVSRGGTAIWDVQLGYVFGAPPISRGGRTWFLRPQLERHGDSYECSGSASEEGEPRGPLLTCSWSYEGT